jgi:type IV pilus assembly protein PilC
MPKYTYTAYDDAGKVIEGVLTAENAEVVRGKLRDRGFYATMVAEQKVKTSRMLALRAGVSFGDLVVFSRQFATMVSAGLSLVNCLDVLKRQTPSLRLQRTIEVIRSDIEEGLPLSEALSKHPKVFPPLYIHLVHAGEVGGILDQTLEKLAVYLEKELQFRQSLRAAFAYPSIVFFVAMAAVIFLVVRIIPVFAGFFETAGVPLPLPTRIMVRLSKVLIGYWWALLLGIGGIVLGFNLFKKTPPGRLIIDRLKLKIPVFGPLNRIVTISRFIVALGSMVASGVPMLQSLEIVREVANNRVVTGVIDEIRENIREGKRLAEPLDNSSIFPPIVAQMVAVGEESGSLDEMLAKCGTFLERDIEYMVRRITAIIEPLLIVGVGIIIGFIAISIYLPMFDIIAVAGR